MSSPGRRASCLREAAGPVDSLLQAAPGRIDEDAGQAEVPGGGMLFIRGTGTAASRKYLQEQCQDASQTMGCSKVVLPMPRVHEW